MVPRSCNNEYGLLEDKDVGVGDSRASSDMGKSLQPLLTRDEGVSCSYEKQVIRDTATVEVAAEGGDVSDDNKSVITVTYGRCLVELEVRKGISERAFRPHPLGFQGVGKEARVT